MASRVDKDDVIQLRRKYPICSGRTGYSGRWMAAKTGRQARGPDVEPQRHDEAKRPPPPFPPFREYDMNGLC